MTPTQIVHCLDLVCEVLAAGLMYWMIVYAASYKYCLHRNKLMAKQRAKRK